MRDFVQLLRPHQWIKNLLVVVPLMFGHPLDRWSQYTFSILSTLLAFSLIASFVYILNDIVDRERDRHHPTKRYRPLARGRISLQAALTLAIVLFVSGIGLAVWVRPFLAGILMLYVVNNILYTFVLKHIPLLDVFSVAAGFILRVYGGAVAVAVPVSVYLFLTVFFLALFFGLGKRRHEILALVESAGHHRKTLTIYTVYYLDQLMLISATLALVVYTLYTVESRPTMVYTVPVAVFGIFRYYHLTHNLNRGEPTDELLTDPWILGAGVVYGGLTIWSLWRVP